MFIVYKYFVMYNTASNVKSATNSYFVSVFVGWHFSGGGSILLALHQIPLQPDQLSPKCLADHQTSPTTAGNVQTAIAIWKMDACVSSEDADQLSPKCLADHPTSQTTAGNVQTAIAIQKLDACVSSEDVPNTRYKSVSSTACVLYTSIL